LFDDSPNANGAVQQVIFNTQYNNLAVQTVQV